MCSGFSPVSESALLSFGEGETAEKKISFF
jgi:hypothetical protein